MTNSIMIVNIKSNGSDQGLFVNGMCKLTADPNFEDIEPITILAKILSEEMNVLIEEIDIHPEEDWNWSDIQLILNENKALDI